MVLRVSEGIKTYKLSEEEIEKYTISDPEDLLARVNKALESEHRNIRHKESLKNRNRKKRIK